MGPVSGGGRNPTATPPAARAAWIAFASVTAATFAVNLDRTMVAVALPQIGATYGGAGLDAVVTLNLVAVAVASPGAGWLADRYGAKRLLLAAMGAFVLSSLAAAAAPTMTTLLLARALQGASGGLTLAVTLATVHSLFESWQRPKAFAVQSVVLMVSPALGPLCGGWVSAIDWRVTFVAVAAVGAIAIAVAWRFLPSDGTGRHVEGVDWQGWVLVGIGLPSALLVATFGNEWGWTTPRVLVLVLTGVVGLAAFVRRQLRIASPLMQLSVLSDRTLRSTFALEWLITIPYQSQFVLLPLKLTTLMGASPLVAGAMITPSALGTMLSMRFAGRLLARRGARINVLIGCGCLLLATAALAFVGRDTSLWVVALIMVAHGLGGGFSLMPLLVAGLDAVDAPLVPQVSAMRIVNKLISQAVGVAVSVGVLVVLAGGDALTAAAADPSRALAAYRQVDLLLCLPLVACLVGQWRSRVLDAAGG